MARGATLYLLVALSGCQLVLGEKKLPPPPSPPPPPSAPGAWAAVAAGATHTCAIKTDGTLWCWGRGDVGQLGLGDGTVEQDTPMQVGDATWSAISTSDATTCGIQTDGTLWCWGGNADNSVGDGTGMDAPVPVHVTGGPYAAVSAGYYDTCAIKTDGTLWCWGYNIDGEVGNGKAPAGAPVPTPIATSQRFTQVSLGAGQACAIASDGTLWCWGYNVVGEVGNDSTMSQPTPVQIGTDTWANIAAGSAHTCGVQTDGRLRCWGANDVGELGNGTEDSAVTPVPTIYDDTHWSRVATGGRDTCAVRDDGAVWCWGENGAGQLAIDLPTFEEPAPTPVAPALGEPVAALALGGAHTCALTATGHLWCAGLAALGAVGDGTGVARTPVQLPGTWTTASAQRLTTCAIDDMQRLACWGDNGWGQLGDGTKLVRRTPVLVDGAGWTAVSVGNGHTCGLQGTALWCWGINAYGELGDGTNAARPVPVQVTQMDGSHAAWQQVSASDQTCAIDMTGGLWCWGYNAHGELGDGTNTPSNNPVRITIPAGTWSAVATGAEGTPEVGYGYACGVLDGALQCWGSNVYGELGDPTAMGQRATPAATPAAMGLAATQLALGPAHAVVSVAGTAWAWGANPYGELGDGTMTLQPSPVALAKTGWLELASGEDHTCGIATDHGLWCWGHNAYGQLGTGVLDDAPLPKQVGTDTHWLHVYAAMRHTCALDDAQHLWCWGADDAGQLGTGLDTRPTFVEVPGD